MILWRILCTLSHSTLLVIKFQVSTGHVRQCVSIIQKNYSSWLLPPLQSWLEDCNIKWVVPIRFYVLWHTIIVCCSSVRRHHEISQVCFIEICQVCCFIDAWGRIAEDLTMSWFVVLLVPELREVLRDAIQWHNIICIILSRYKCDSERFVLIDLYNVLVRFASYW